MTHKENVVAAWHHAWNDGDLTGLEALLAPDYRRHSRTGTADRREFLAALEATRVAFPDLRTHVEHLAEDGDLVAVNWRSEGTHLGPFHELPVTRRRITTSGMTFARFAGGQVQEEWVSWESGDLFANLGVVNLWEY
ncbi:ester cyclase [Amycolatopsis acidiphila]|uniref:ester cyclase n=1 Tax=Amycolatopsis acidiphila TaxID=715473 RepID=UPI001643818C|nr:ester cyclase [Amycolatopsis acidiphila]UIJ62592.1 ester cyclase [Amycolatopsis acidiphila]GHG85634.1 hypothetical protein GCM10017788_58440 [Amycolatopsis acidiphila]